jgi:hypothetical protein
MSDVNGTAARAQWDALTYHQRLPLAAQLGIPAPLAHVEWEALPPEAREAMKQALSVESPLRRQLIQQEGPVGMWQQDGGRMIISPEGEEPFEEGRWAELLRKYAIAGAPAPRQGHSPPPQGSVPARAEIMQGNPIALSRCEKQHRLGPKLERCVRRIQARPKSQQPRNKFAVCRASISRPVCPAKR